MIIFLKIVINAWLPQIRDELKTLEKVCCNNHQVSFIPTIANPPTRNTQNFGIPENLVIFRIDHLPLK